MQANDIYSEMTDRQIKLAGGLLAVACLSERKKHENFKRAFYDYTCEKLSEDKDNNIIVEEISYMFHQLDKQFASLTEKEKFYEHYVHYILSIYGNVVGKEHLWRLNDDATNTYPRIVDDYLETSPSTSNEDTAIWLFNILDQTIIEKLDSQSQSTKKKIKK